jgi:hypothetical protein
MLLDHLYRGQNCRRMVATLPQQFCGLRAFGAMPA